MKKESNPPPPAPPSKRVVNVRRWAVNWWAWPDGARLPSSGTEYVEAATKLEAEAILKARYPGIDRMEAH